MIRFCEQGYYFSVIHPTVAPSRRILAARLIAIVGTCLTHQSYSISHPLLRKQQIVPFELPEEICRQQAAMEALHVEHWSQRQELSRRGLTVVYDDQGGREEFALKQSGGRRAGGKVSS